MPAQRQSAETVSKRIKKQKEIPVIGHPRRDVLTIFLMLVKISLHLAEQARNRRVTWYCFISVMAFFHSAELNGIAGREAGICWD